MNSLKMGKENEGGDEKEFEIRRDEWQNRVSSATPERYPNILNQSVLQEIPDGQLSGAWCWGSCLQVGYQHFPPNNVECSGSRIFTMLRIRNQDQEVFFVSKDKRIWIFKKDLKSKSLGTPQASEELFISLRRSLRLFRENIQWIFYLWCRQ